MNHIRPYRFLGLFNAPISERIAHVPNPNRLGSGGISLLEASLLVAAVRIVDARRMFEFGTFLGNTTLLLATISPDDAA
jgi:predicted O-methyltransferase YrrM